MTLDNAVEISRLACTTKFNFGVSNDGTDSKPACRSGQVGYELLMVLDATTFLMPEDL